MDAHLVGGAVGLAAEDSAPGGEIALRAAHTRTVRVLVLNWILSRNARSSDERRGREHE